MKPIRHIVECLLIGVLFLVLFYSLDDSWWYIILYIGISILPTIALVINHTQESRASDICTSIVCVLMLWGTLWKTLQLLTLFGQLAIFVSKLQLGLMWVCYRAHKKKIDYYQQVSPDGAAPGFRPWTWKNYFSSFFKGFFQG